MADATSPAGSTRVVLSKAQLQTALGVELLQLCQTVTADGSLSPDEIAHLRQWLTDAGDADLPAIAFLREVVNRILADGRVTDAEARELYRAIESVLPPDARRLASMSRRLADGEQRQQARELKAKEREAKQQARAALREEVRRNSPIEDADFMVAGCLHEGRPKLIERYARAGDPVQLVRDPENRYSRNAIKVLTDSGHCVGMVPEEDAETLAPLLDRGAQYRARFKKILDGRRAPTPVVVAEFYSKDATLEPESTAASISPAVASPSEGSAVRGFIWMAILVAVVVIAFRSCS